jgi:hypothetical protein
MAKTDRTAAISAAVAAIEKGEVADDSAATVKFKCDRTSIPRRIRGLTQAVCIFM